MRRQQLGQGERDCQVDVVAAGVHDAVAAGAVGQVGRLLEREPIHVGAYQYAAACLGAAQRPQYSGLGDPGLHVEPPPLEMLGDGRRGLDFLEGELRLGVEVPASRLKVGAPGLDVLAQPGEHGLILPD